MQLRSFERGTSSFFSTNRLVNELRWFGFLGEVQETMNDSLQTPQVMVSPLTAMRFISVLQ